MVTVFLRGGLGNQMFQYAFGLNLAKRNDADLVLDTVHLSDRFPRRNFTYRTFDLPMVFTLEPRLTPLSRAANTVPLPGVWLGLDLLGMAVRERFLNQRVVYENERQGFDFVALQAKGNIILYGRWQSEKYFKDIESDVRAAFTFRRALSGPAAAIAKEISSSNSVSLHIRRGDYAAFKNVEKVMGKTDIGYYARAASYVAGKVKAPHFYIFSDDIAWCREHIKLPYDATYLDDASAGPRGAFHLELMSFCRHNIIANSTFSWWGAWLNQNPGKIVVAPKRWVADPKIDDRDVVPEGWERV